MIKDEIFTLVFRPDKGEVDRRSLEIKAGQALPLLPIPTRQGYTFGGWYTEENGKGQKFVPGDTPALDGDVILHAHWIKRKAAKKKSLYRTQKNAAIALAISFAALIVVLIGVNALVSILTYTEQYKTIGEDGQVEVISTKYYVKKIDGVYHLCHLKGSFPNWTFEPLPKDKDGYFVTDRDSLIAVNPDTGACQVYAVVEVEGSEVVGYSGRVMMFRQLTYDASSSLGQKPQNRIDKIEVTNAHGSYTFIRQKDADKISNDFYLDGYPTTAFNLESFASLANACGYTISMERLADPDRLPDGTIQFSEYGLAPETRKDEEGNEYAYVPARFTTTAGDGTAYTVIVGDAIVSGAGYYAQLEGRNTVYILSSSGIQDLVLQPIETMLTPMITYPASMNTYFDVEHFVIETGYEYDLIKKVIHKEAFSRLGVSLDTENKTLDEIEKEIADTIAAGTVDKDAHAKVFTEVWNEQYETLLAEHSKKICDFSYLDLEERENTMYSSMSYKSDSEYMKGYFPNFDNVSNALYSLYSIAPLRIVKLDPLTEEDEDGEILDTYGLLEPAHVITYYCDEVDEEGNTYTIFNRVSISQKSSAGIYYAYGEIMTQNQDGDYYYLYTPMIIEFYESAMPFLEWKDIEWYDHSFVQLNVAYLKDVIYAWGENNIHFTLDNTSTSQMTYIIGRGSAHTEKNDKGEERSYTIEKVGGQYVLVGPDGHVLEPINSSHYMVSAQYATKGTVEYPYPQYAKDYMFIESKQDDKTKTYTYYMYYRAGKQDGYKLCADVKVVDANGDLIDARTVEGQVALETDYFYSKSGYLFMLEEHSELASGLTANMGLWGESNVFQTADGKFILIDEDTGTWYTLNTVTPQIYFADKDSSALVINSTERNGITYYPTSGAPLNYNSDQDQIEVYNVAKKAWGKASTSHCTMGVWGNGSYYKTENGMYMLVDHITGEWGYLFLSTVSSSGMQVNVNGKPLDYEVILHTVTGREENSTEVDNFRKMYQGLLTATIEGACELTEQEMAELRAIPDSECQLKLTVTAEDPDGTTRYTIYRFYRYKNSNLKSYMTIELVDSPDDPGDPQNGQGTFFVLTSFVEKLISDAQKVMDGKEVVPNSKN